MKLSPTMEKAKRMAARGGLVRVRGGYWIAGDDYKGSRQIDPVKLRLEEVGTSTVRALESRGVLVLADEPEPEYWRRRVLSSEVSS